MQQTSVNIQNLPMSQTSKKKRTQKNNKKPTINWQKTWMEISLKTIYRWLIGMRKAAQHC